MLKDGSVLESKVLYDSFREKYLGRKVLLYEASDADIIIINHHSSVVSIVLPNNWLLQPCINKLSASHALN